MRLSMLAVIGLVVIAFVTAPCVGSSQAVRQGTEWSMTGLYSGNVGTAADGSLRLLEYTPGDPVRISDALVQCVDPNGHVAWSHRLSGECLGAVVGSEGTTFVSTSYSTDGPAVIALDGNGTTKWTFKTQDLSNGTLDGYVSMPIVVQDGSALFVMQSGLTSYQNVAWLFALDEAGHLKWKMMFHDRYAQLIGILEDSGTVLVATNQSNITAFDNTGSVLWKHDFGKDGYRFEYSPMIQQGSVFVSVRNISRNVPGELWALDGDGDVLWRYELRYDATYMTGGDVASVALGPNRTVYAVTLTGQEVSSELRSALGPDTTYGRTVPGKLIALTSNGTLVWSKEVNGAMSDIFLDGNRRIYLNTGKEIQTFDGQGDIVNRYQAAPGAVLTGLKLSASGMYLLTQTESSGYTKISVSSEAPRDGTSDFIQNNAIPISLTILAAVLVFAVYGYSRKQRGKNRP
jgi:hypothetical protein